MIWKFYLNPYMEDIAMCDMIVRGINTAQDAVWTATSTAYNAVVDSYNCLGRNFENLTNKLLPPTAARVVQTMFYALPITVAALTLPTYVHLTAMAAYGVVHVAYSLVGQKDARPLSDTFYNNLWTGVGTAFLYTAAKETVNMAMRIKGANIVSIAVKLLATSFFYTLMANYPKPSFGPSNNNPNPPVAAPSTATPTGATTV